MKKENNKISYDKFGNKANPNVSLVPFCFLDGCGRIAKERSEQLLKHHWSISEDRFYGHEELVSAAKFCLTLNEKDYPHSWGNWWFNKVMAKNKRMTSTEFREEMLAISGALCAAEIDRLEFIRKQTEENNVL